MTRHGIGTTPNIYMEDGTLAMKGGTPRIEDWPGAEASGEGKPLTLVEQLQADCKRTVIERDRAEAEVERLRERPDATFFNRVKRERDEAEADNRALMEALREADRHFRDGKVNRGQLVIQAALETVSGQGEKP